MFIINSPVTQRGGCIHIEYKNSNGADRDVRVARKIENTRYSSFL